jgi:hypothetical protein
MLPIRARSIFKSRWIALLWAGGIIWTAVEFAGSHPQNDTAANAASNEDVAATQAAMNALGIQ